MEPGCFPVVLCLKESRGSWEAKHPACLRHLPREFVNKQQLPSCCYAGAALLTAVNINFLLALFSFLRIPADLSPTTAFLC